MFLNNLSIYSIPFIGIIFLVISLTFSKTISIFTYQLSSRQKKRHSTIESQNLHVSIQVNPFSQLDNVDGYRQRSTTITLDDDEELIKSDVSSISASSFCENDSIELRLDQDLDYDDDIEGKTDN